jgi:malonyl-CoA O-methyltransferase
VPQQLVIPDKQHAQRAFQRAAGSYDAAAVLQQEVGRRLLERLDVIKLEPACAVDVGAGTGFVADALLKRYAGAQVVALDLAPEMLQRARRRGRLWRRPVAVCADAESLPLCTGSVDVIVSNLALPWLQSLDRAFTSSLRVLRPGGLLLFSSFGPDTLKELRQAWAAADGAVHVHDFIDMHDVGDALMRAGFADPVLETDRITMTYRSLDDLMRDIKNTGGVNVAQPRRRGLTLPRALQAMRGAYERYRQPDGRLPATIEVVYGHAWAPRERPQRQVAGEVRVPLSRIGRREVR